MLDYQEFKGLKKSECLNQTDIMMEDLNRKGFHVIENFISNKQVASLRSKVLSIWEEQKSKYGEKLLSSIGDLGVCRAMFEIEPEFLELIASQEFTEILTPTVGESGILHLQNGIILFPDLKHNQARYHRDFPKSFISSELLSINLFILLDDFTRANGGTYLVPNSHKISEMPSERFINENEVQLQAPAGSVLVFDSMLWHKGGRNNTSSPRVAINNQFTRPFIKQQLNYPEIMKGKVEMESIQAQRLGMWAIPPRSVDEYRVSDPKLRTYRAGQG